MSAEPQTKIPLFIDALVLPHNPIKSQQVCYQHKFYRPKISFVQDVVKLSESQLALSCKASDKIKEVSPASRLAGDFLVSCQPVSRRPKVSCQPAIEILIRK